MAQFSKYGKNIPRSKDPSLIHSSKRNLKKILPTERVSPTKWKFWRAQYRMPFKARNSICITKNYRTLQLPNWKIPKSWPISEREDSVPKHDYSGTKGSSLRYLHRSGCKRQLISTNSSTHPAHKSISQSVTSHTTSL